MTCAVAYRPWPKRARGGKHREGTPFAVLAVDGRITDEDGTLYTDTAAKYACSGELVAVFAGDLGPMQNAMRALLDAPAQTNIVSAARMLCRETKDDCTDDRGWSALIYHTRTRDLFSCDSDGSRLKLWGTHAAIGTGSEVAMGYFAGKIDRFTQLSPNEARRTCRNAIHAAAARNTTVGNKTTVIYVSHTGRVSVRAAAPARKQTQQADST